MRNQMPIVFIHLMSTFNYFYIMQASKDQGKVYYEFLMNVETCKETDELFPFFDISYDCFSATFRWEIFLDFLVPRLSKFAMLNSKKHKKF